MGENIKKIKTGIQGLDEVLKGGILENHSILFTGAPGVGKSIAALQFIYYGAKNNEPGIIITTEGSASFLRLNANYLGLALDELEKKGLVTIIEQPINSGRVMSLDAPINLIKKKNIKRLALDSLSIFEFIYGETAKEFKKGIMDFIYLMKQLGVSFVATSENTTTDLDDFKFKEVDFLFDGVIILTRVRKGATFERCITVPKMRGQDHLINIYPISIGRGGVKVLANEIPFSLMEKDAEPRFR